MKQKPYSLVAMLMLISLLLLSLLQAACQPTTVEVVKTVVVEKEGQTIVVTATAEPKPEQPPAPKVLRMNLSAGDIPTLDPSLASDVSSVQVLEETFVGLTRLDEKAISVVPGLAESWDAGPDGKTYTFHLRKDVPWVEYDAVKGEVVKVQSCDGQDRMVTANDVVYGALRTLNPATASTYAYVLGFVIDGASDYLGGKTTDPATVGIRAVDDATVEIKFKTPAAYNLNIAGMWVAYAQPKWVIDGDDCTKARGERWIETGFFQSYGPYTLKEWVHDSYLTVIKNPFWPGSADVPQAKIAEVMFTMLDDVPAFADYEAGNLDWVARVPLADIDRVKTDPVLSKEMVIMPALGTYFFGFNTKAPFVDDLRVRRALSMAVDRQSLIDNVAKGNQEPAQWFCRPGLVGCPTIATHPDLGVKYDPVKAKGLLDEYLKEKNLTAGQLDITLMFNTSSSNQKIAEAIQQMWKDALGVTVKLTSQEFRVFLATIKSKDTPQMYRRSWSQDYPDANNFTRENFVKGGNNNPLDENGQVFGGVNWDNPRFEELAVQAAQEMDPLKRIELYAQMEQILVWEDAVIIPIYWTTTTQATKPNVVRTFSNTGVEHIEKWDILQ